MCPAGPRRRRGGRCVSRGGDGPRADAGLPRLFEEVAQTIPCLRDGYARDDRLEEAHDDELARLVGRDPATLEIEQLALVDGTDRAGVGSASAVRLVDLQAGDGDGPRRLREVHAELA